ncbi:hypothetical protein H9L21_09995 [Aeromicrobium senzhongii]|uniref:Uncharacterized protein n=1 Tax=Aeromicrobium senzhongii TaxID=2663859 RepID=A0ABX6SQM8_9ACTN|nr:hypothetical protein [Aeromicrobium senzhongii]MTB89290.1 hypothetical protein [Aeromicrobium senzhongii]QNL93448.1 hypothetical protein H9L21_09995 [Aeromicrobium senzhongii]
MALLALVLLAICLAQYLRQIGPAWVIAVQGVLMIAIVVLTAHGLGYGPGAGWLPVIVGFWWASARALPSWRLPGMIASGVAGLLALVASPLIDRDTPPLLDWFEDLGVPGLMNVGLDEFVLAVVIAVALIGPANAVVREVLDRVGRGLLGEERRLKGGRVIGPLERVMVFAFAVGGNYGGVAAILAAKGILRFPEISRDEGDGSRAEYVLVGSFVSWFLALALVPLF